MLFQGSSQWMIGRNVTNYFELINMGANDIQFPGKDNSYDGLALVNQNRLIYLHMSSLCQIITNLLLEILLLDILLLIKTLE